jgi:hypothetical protein
MRGQRWLDGATYLTPADRAAVMAEVERARAALREQERAGCGAPGFGPRSVGVRCPAYIGEPAPIATVTYGPGGCSIWRSVYRSWQEANRAAAARLREAELASYQNQRAFGPVRTASGR